MVDIDGKDLQEPSLSSGGDGVCSVVRIRPRISAIGKATVREVVYDPLVRVLFRAHKNEMLQSVRTAGVIENFGGHDEITIHDGGVIFQVNYAKTGNPAAPAGDRDLGKVELDALYEVKISVSLARSRRGMRMQGRGHVGLGCQTRGNSGTRSRKKGGWSRRGGSSFEKGQ
jgi:hypothetical protein